MFSLIRPLLASALALAGLPATSADLRDCRLDALTFIDPWGGISFSVDRAGEYRFYLCDIDGSEVMTESPDDPAACRGPYGELVLEGHAEMRGPQVDDRRYAVFHVMPAAPCCGWSLYLDETMPQDILGQTTWYAPGEAPTLGTRPFASIEVEPGYGTDDWQLNPMYALACDHPLP